MRYFLFYYRHQSGFGNIAVRSDNNNFPNSKIMTSAISEKTGESEETIVISGWNEFLSKKDYDDFNA